MARFFASEAFTQLDAARLIVPLLGPVPLTLVMDRTVLGRTGFRPKRTRLSKPGLPLRTPARNWTFGQHDHNILVIGAVFAGYAIALVWNVLDHGGARSTTARIELLDRLLTVVPARHIKVLLADRRAGPVGAVLPKTEFVGQAWFAALAKRRLKRCIRIREDTLVDDLTVREAVKGLAQGEVRGLLDKEVVYGSRLQVVATLSEEGGRVVIASDLSMFETCAVYRSRWSVECTFGAYKLRGLNLEATHMTDPVRVATLVGLLTVAFVWALGVGLGREAEGPVRVKGHGRKAKSSFLMGLDALVDALKWNRERARRFLALLFPALHTAPDQPVGY